jgi:hypothetical protein
MNNYPSESVKKFGEELGMALFDADIHRALGGLGGCKHFDLNNFKEEFHPYILEYFKGNNDSCAIIYAAMKTKEQNEL